jgi:hypothetical protein
MSLNSYTMEAELMELALVRAGFAVQVEKKLFMKGETLIIDHSTGIVRLEVANRGGKIEVGKVVIAKLGNVETHLKFDPYLLVPVKMGIM